MLPTSTVASLFEPGKRSVKSYEIKKQTDAYRSPPKPLFIVTPTQAGSYPVILFLHGFCMRNCYYRQLLEHIASHGYIAVAPQLGFSPFPSCINGQAVDPEATMGSSSLSFSNKDNPAACRIQNEDIHPAADVTNWLPGGLQKALPTGVQANLQKLALAAHSKGGHTAFALATKKYAHTALDFSVVVGIDPVAGIEILPGWKCQISPEILTYRSNSFDIHVPTLVVGSGLGEERKMGILPACAPTSLNHAEFFNECNPPSNYFVVKNYGHLDMLDDNVSQLALMACQCGEGCRGNMRRSIAGLVIAFLEAYLDGKGEDLAAVVADPSVAPAALHPVQEKKPTQREAAMSRL